MQQKSAPVGADSSARLFRVALQSSIKAYSHRHLRNAIISEAVLFRIALLDDFLCDVWWNLFVTVDFHS